MNIKPLGRITVATAASDIIRVTVNETDATLRVSGSEIVFQRNDDTETGRVYIVDSSDGVIPDNVIGVLGVPPASGEMPKIRHKFENAPGGLNAADFYVRAELDGEGCVAWVVKP